MNRYQTFRECISSNDKELIIYGADTFSQFPRRDASLSSKCDRALPVACRDDLVVLRGKLDMEYHNWLHSHGLGPDHVVQYKAPSRLMSLSELIVTNPEPIKISFKRPAENRYTFHAFQGIWKLKPQKFLVLIFLGHLNLQH